ncbi:hypothetical protein Vadar_024718 [Vaccinium darrowii]|uniref:Uncharacterized protein n=1 Tax=Vaccinium darrowii TaxID=229202 RepID=A0ACB7X3T2_9ERIC|nr:hypothetical protein Vadar_024718 [Vaccinium darrowii]
MAQTGDCTTECKGVGEITVVKKTRSAMEVTASSTAGSFKRRKLESDVREQSVSNCYDANSLEDHDSITAISEDSDRASVSRCSSNDSSELATKRELKSVDLKVESYAKGYETEISKLVKCRFSRETTPSSEISADTDELESSTATKPPAASLRRRNPVTNMPPAAEIEAFFSAAERDDQKRFAEKYNYDVQKDVPLEGRYQWVRLKP